MVGKRVNNKNRFYLCNGINVCMSNYNCRLLNNVNIPFLHTKESKRFLTHIFWKLNVT